MPRSNRSIPRRILILALITACRPSPAPRPAPPAPAVAPSVHPPSVVAAPPRTIQVNGTVLTFRLLGDQGTPVVFVHGSGGDLDSWAQQTDTFARTHRVLVYSRRYHPPNPPIDDGRVYSPLLHAEDLAALLAALGLTPAHIVGSGYGAYVAIELALTHPELVRSLVIGEPPVIPLLLRTPEGDSTRRVFVAGVLDPARNAFARGDSVAALRAFVDGLSNSPGRFDNLPGPSRERILAHTFELRREMLADRQQYLPALDCAGLGRLTVPVLLLQGDRSARMFHLITTELARCMQSDTVITILGARHGMQVANPGFYNRTVLRYLDAH